MKALPRWIQWSFIALLLFAFITRVYRLDVPSTYYFDEVYHAVTAKLILHNDVRAYEWSNPPPEPNTAVDWLHPPVAKLAQAASMAVFGENSFGWRFSSVLFGTATIVLVFWLALELGFSPATAVLAMALLAFDGLALTTSRIAMNDAHVTFFFVLAIWLFARWKKNPTERRAVAVAVAAGLAAASKWSGFFVAGAIGIDQSIQLLLSGKAWRKKISASFFLAGALALMIPALYLLSYSQMFAQGKTWSHFRELLRQTWWYQTHLEATHPYQSTPIEWVLDLRPVYVYADFSQPGTLQNIYMLGNPLIFWVGILAILWSVSDLVVMARKHLSPTERNERNSLVLLLIAYGITWIPWIASPRIMFFYHYLPALPFLVLLLAHQLGKLSHEHTAGKWFVRFFMIAVAVTFGLFFPHWTALPVPSGWSSLFFLFPRWR